MEHVWSTSKWGPLANAPPDNIDQLNRLLDIDLARQATEQRLLKGHFRWAGLGLE